MNRIESTLNRRLTEASLEANEAINKIRRDYTNVKQVHVITRKMRRCDELRNRLQGHTVNVRHNEIIIKL